jgi:cytochrome c-type biogenesis protein CcmF
MAFLGKLFLILSALISVFLAGYILYALGQKGKHKERGFRNSYWGIIWLFFTVSISTFVLLAAFIAKDFTFQYVASHSSADMALVYRIAALWAGQEGSLLLWLWMTAAIAAVIAFRKLKDPDAYTAHVLLVMNVVNFFFLLVLLVSSDPFKTATSPVAAGMGINPLLLHWAMILHPPTVFMGNALLTVPFAYAIAAMLLKKADASWVNLCRRWTIFAWIFVSLGIFLGALWAYVVLGWGGYWGWDPVENASLLPWLTATALLHSFTAYRHRGNFKIWSISLAIISFLLTVVATFITRSGLVQSVHAFQRDPFFTFIFAVFMALIVFGGFGLLYSRRKLFASAESFTSLLSREFTYYVSNLILVISTAIVLTATVLPSFTGMQMGPQFYNRIAPPIGLVFLLVLTLCPLFSWRKTDTAKLMRSLYLPLGATALAAAPLFLYWRGLEAGIRSVNASRQPAVLGYVGWLIAVFSLVVVLQLFVSLARQRSRRFETGVFASLLDLFRFSPSQAGGFITHLGVVVMVIGLAGSSMFVLNTKKRVDNVPGSTFEVDNLVMSFRQVDTSTAPNRETYGAIFDIYNKGDRNYVGTIRPKIVFYQLQNQSTREVDIRYEALRDIFVIFEGVDSDNKLVMNTFINPLISWVWVGSLVLILGSLFALLPHRHDVRLEGE